MSAQAVDQVALLPAYAAAGTAVAIFVADLVVPGRRSVSLGLGVLGALGTAVAAVLLGTGGVRRTFCTPAGCSYVADRSGAVVATLFAALTLGVLLLSWFAARPAGEYAFLLACSMTGGVVLGYARDLITLIIAVETLTLPLYALVGLRRRSVASAEGAITFFIVSVVSTAVTLLGVGLLYAATGAVHFAALLTADAPGRLGPLATTGSGLVLVGLAFKVAAVPFHAWAPVAYDGAPLPIAAYLSTASKLGGLVAVLYVTVGALRPWLAATGAVLAVLAVVTMTVGNLVALRQRRMVRLLAWSSIAQAGYMLAPLGAFATADGRTAEAIHAAVTASIGYLMLYATLELLAFGCVIALRGPGDGGTLDDYRGVARWAPWLAAGLVVALAGLAGLPPGLAGLFAKVAVVRALLVGHAGWLAVIVALNAVVALAYYVRAAVVLFQPAGGEPLRRTVAWPVATGIGLVGIAAIVLGVAPQFVLDAAGAVLR